MKRLPTLFILATSTLQIIAILLLSSCGLREKPKTFVVGFSQCVDDNWRKSMVEGMKRELSFHSNLSFVMKQANGSSETQIQQVRELVKEPIDLLIISPNEVQPLTPVVEDVYNKGIPVIVLDRKIASKLYTSFVGSDNFEIGKQAGDYAAKILQGHGNIIEVWGLTKSSPAMERHAGFVEAISAYPGMKLIDSVHSDWNKYTTEKLLPQHIPATGTVDLVFAHNDVMGLGAYDVFKSLHNYPMPKILGVDGLAGDAGGMQFVSDKILTATMVYMTGGEESMKIASKILNKEDFTRDNLLQTCVVDSTNVRLFQLQASKMVGQQKEISRQQSMLYEQLKIANNQRTFVYVLIATLLLALLLGATIFYSLNQNRKMNRQLQLQNMEISDQRNRLVEMSSQAQLANDARANFFTNISHEFRTPLTLILGPIEDMRSNPRAVTPARISLVHKNAVRLLSMVNQLIDFRKIEVDKMKVQASENDIIEFVRDIVNAHRIIAQKKDIELQVITREKNVKVWFDPSLFDKVIDNLLSNALKFTDQNGYINIHIEKTESENNVTIRVEDNGIGMTKEEEAHVFEMFYQAGKGNYNSSSGIGLSLAKELVHLHGGRLHVSSEKWKGSVFTIKLPLGSSHLTPEERLAESQRASAVPAKQDGYVIDESASRNDGVESRSPLAKQHTILIVEDNDDLRSFLVDHLNQTYEVFEAVNGELAVQQAFAAIPDLIICDIVIAPPDGFELTAILKSDARTAHIPIVLLSAKINIEQQIQGMRNMADAYITKPFNVTFLDETIRSLINNRDRLKEHFSCDTQIQTRCQAAGKIDRKFINEFTSFIESNFANESLAVEDIGKHLGVSKMQLYRKVKVLMGVNINDYILNVRLKKARYMLLNEALRVSEVSYKVGFSSPGYFATVFRTKFKVTPKEFRNKSL